VPASRDAIMARLREAFVAGNFAAVYELAADDYVEEYPQSREVIRSRANAEAIDAAYPGRLPTVAGETRFTECGETLVVEAVWDYGESGTYHVLGVWRVADGALAASRIYFASPLAAPEWRSRWVETS
jgi:ketosteroid isomerase-like protein